MDLLNLIQSIQNNLFRFLMVLVVAHTVGSVILAWIKGYFYGEAKKP